MVLATNIAETSITIDDCVLVIDTGRMKQLSYQAEKRITALEEVWVSQANAMQRRGRAGRVRAGTCFHLFTQHRFDHCMKPQQVGGGRRVDDSRGGMTGQGQALATTAALPSAQVLHSFPPSTPCCPHRRLCRLSSTPRQEPEIRRVPLEQLALRVKTVWPQMAAAMQISSAQSVEEVLGRALDPPEKSAVAASLSLLNALGALDEDQTLTPLGWHLSALPVDVRVGKLLLFGAMFACVDQALTIAASLCVGVATGSAQMRAEPSPCPATRFNSPPPFTSFRSVKSPFYSPFDQRDEAKKKRLELKRGDSDHLTLLHAYSRWQSEKTPGAKRRVGGRVRSPRHALSSAASGFFSAARLTPAPDPPVLQRIFPVADDAEPDERNQAAAACSAERARLCAAGHSRPQRCPPRPETRQRWHCRGGWARIQCQQQPGRCHQSHSDCGLCRQLRLRKARRGGARARRPAQEAGDWRWHVWPSLFIVLAVSQRGMLTSAVQCF